MPPTVTKSVKAISSINLMAQVTRSKTFGSINKASLMEYASQI